MTSYNGRRAPNFSQYLEDLNTIPSPYDQSGQQQNEPFNIDAELALFTNAEFLDFGHFGDLNMPLTYDPAEDEKARQENAGSDKNNNVNYLDLLNGKYMMLIYGECSASLEILRLFFQNSLSFAPRRICDNSPLDIPLFPLLLRHWIDSDCNPFISPAFFYVYIFVCVEDILVGDVC